MKDENLWNSDEILVLLFIPKENIEGNFNAQMHSHKQLFLYSPLPIHPFLQCTGMQNKRTNLVNLGVQQQPEQQSCYHSANISCCSGI